MRATRRSHRRVGAALSGALSAGLVLGLLAGTGSATGTESATGTGAARSRVTPAVSLPPIRHVFVIMLENEDYSQTFGDPGADPYLATTLRDQGALLKNDYAVGHFSLDNYIALISGQPPNKDTQGDCFLYSNYVGFTAGQENGIQQGQGCVYPSVIETLPDQLDAAGFTWKGYMEDMGNDPARDGGTVCAHPTLGDSDSAVFAEASSDSVPDGDGYATRHDPFVYFESITDDTTECDQDVVPLGTTSGAMPAGTPAGVTGLASDLQSASTTPNFSWITPNLCDDGHDYPCTNEPTPGSSAVADVDDFLETWVPIIEASPAFEEDGLLEITWDEAEDPHLDTRACCGEQPGPGAITNKKGKPENGLSGPGGGRVGALLISPYVTAGKTVKTKLNHYSSLATIEDIFGLARLASAQTVKTNFDTVFNSTPVWPPG
ncbi:MAG TPA: alkaline phosphatase family protein [Acidimicrobiales bacterium]|nr:alkaline phosphatase family protein [Acidimicrobiales bacterium]